MEASEFAERWHHWSPDNTVSYEHLPRRGAGKGEAKLIAESCFGGEIQGGTVSYDILDSQGRKWEVKELDKSREVRLGVESTEEVIHFWTEAVMCCRQIEKFTEMSGAFSSCDVNNFDPFEHHVENFVSEGSRKILRGEMAKGTILGGTRQTPVGLKQIVDYLGSHIISATKRYAEVGHPSLLVPYEAVIGFLLEQGEDPSVLNPDPLEVARSVLRHPFFKDPGILSRAWAEASKPSVVFGQVDGVIMVNETGFFVVPRERLDSYFKFERISQRVARFKFIPSPGAAVSGIMECHTRRRKGLPASQQVIDTVRPVETC